MKKTLIASLTLAALAASPAFAQNQAERMHQAVHRSTATSEYFASVPGYVPGDPYAVVSSNRVIGRDMDANVRLQLLRDAGVSQN
ncbi:MAG TPA: hypothetical protein VMH84_10615 [Xanthobacteraceae bacterium]|nr:hypothetical protein [Xanthobacteraceae bacterium]